MSKEAATGYWVGGIVLVVGLVITGYPPSWYTVVAIIAGICGGLIAWLQAREKRRAAHPEE